jgi:predicted RNA-binding protein associated with RNAse of E/G family
MMEKRKRGKRRHNHGELLVEILERLIVVEERIMATSQDLKDAIAAAAASVNAEIQRVEALITAGGAQLITQADLDQAVADVAAIKAVADAERP